MIGIEAACVGTLTRETDHRISKNGTPFTLLNIQVGDSDSRQYVSAIVFGDVSLKVANLERSRYVYLEGKIELSEWTGQDGKTRAKFVRSPLAEIQNRVAHHTMNEFEGGQSLQKQLRCIEIVHCLSNLSSQ
jgi:single-stranded DNA-binding protein